MSKLKFIPNFWEEQHILSESDYIVIGAGLTGLFTAIALKRKSPKKRIVVVDRGTLPIGASTRNAGFACFGSPSEILSDIKEMGEYEAFSLVENRWKGLKRLLKICQPDQIGFEPIGGNEIFLKKDESSAQEALDHLSFLNKKLFEITGEKNVYQIDNSQKGCFSTLVDMIIYNRLEGQLNSGKLIGHLFSQLRTLDIEFYGGLEVKEINEAAGNVVLLTDTFKLKTNHLVIATNAFTSQFIPEVEIHTSAQSSADYGANRKLKMERKFSFG